MQKGLSCHCNTMSCKNKTCLTDGICYTSVSRNTAKNKNNTVVTYGCIGESQLFPIANPLWCREDKESRLNVVTACCRNGSFCNKLLLPTLASPIVLAGNTGRNTSSYLVSDVINKGDFQQLNSWLTVIIPFSILLVIVALTIFGVVCVLCLRRRKSAEHIESGESQIGCDHGNMSIETTREDESGSGAGARLLISRTISMEIELGSVIGKGRYGEVWLGSWKGEDVAVKVFHSREELSWRHEIDVHQTVMLRHQNVLGFIGADSKDNGTWTQLWLITDYHPLGSLYDYLITTTLNLKALMKIIVSITCGLSHMHTEIIGTLGKPSIAHRDIKSRNILVKADGSCCIADLGLAVKQGSAMDASLKKNVGTIRYMAPEFLNDSTDITDFDSLKQADVYSLGLVFWEVTRRCNGLHGEHFDHQLPYYDVVNSDPSREEMLKVVSADRRRPEIPQTWQNCDILRNLSVVMSGCWGHSSAARLSVQRIKKNVSKLENQLHNTKMNVKEKHLEVEVPGGANPKRTVHFNFTNTSPAVVVATPECPNVQGAPFVLYTMLGKCLDRMGVKYKLKYASLIR